jgi:hypothetical protein
MPVLPARYEIIETDGRKNKVLCHPKTPVHKRLIEFLSSNALLTRHVFNQLISKDDAEVELVIEALERTKLVSILGIDTVYVDFLLDNPDILSRFMAEKKPGDIKSERNFKRIELLYLLFRHGLLKEESDKNIYIQCILFHPVFSQYSYLIKTLAHSRLLNRENLNKVLIYKNPVNVGALGRKFCREVAGIWDHFPLTKSDRTPPNLPSAEAAYPPQEDNELQVLSGLSILGDIMPILATWGLITQARFDKILQLPTPHLFTSILREIKQAKIPLAHFIDRILTCDNLYLFDNIISKLHYDKFLTEVTLDYALQGAFNLDHSYCIEQMQEAVRILATNDLLTPQNVAFIYKGEFTPGPFINNSFPPNHVCVDHARILVALKNKCPWMPTTTYGKLIKLVETSVSQPFTEGRPFPELLHDLEHMIVYYLKQSQHKDSRKFPLCVELFALYQLLLQAQRDYQDTGCKTTFLDKCKTAINNSKQKIATCFSLTEMVTAWFNAILNTLQNLIYKPNPQRKSWGRFFDDGHRLALLASLEKEAASFVADIQSPDIPAMSKLSDQ